MTASDLVTGVVAAARAAGDLIQRVRTEGFDVHHKGGSGPVTEADRGADALLKERLLGLEHAAWLSEETADDKGRLAARRVWIVDPLDGTKEFVKGLPEYTVAIALVEDGEPVLGVVHNPASGETFWAERGKGAFTVGRWPLAESVDGKRSTVNDSRILLASRSELAHGEFAPFERDWQIRAVGSIQHKLALVAAGRGAGTLSRGPKHEWDVAAGALIVAEAGGIVTDLEGEPLRFNRPFPKTRGILAAAPETYEQLRTHLARVGASERMAELD